MNADRFIDFLKALLDSVQGKVFLIVDGHPVHKAKKVREFTENNVKNDRVGRGVIMSKDDLKAKAISALRRLQKLPHIVRGFFRDPHLAYILD